MAATCAGCLGPITKGEPFVLSGTEVFHRQCARLISRSRRVKLEVELADHKRRMASLRSELDIARSNAAYHEDSARRLSASEKELQIARAGRDAAIRDSTYWRERAVRAEGDRLVVTADRDRLAEQVRQLTTQLQAAQRAAAPVEPTEAQQITADDKPAKKDLDDSARRFSLLELD